MERLNPKRRDAASNRHKRLWKIGGIAMKRYAPFKFRPGFALAAAALTIATLSLTVVIPAVMAPEPGAMTTVAQHEAASGAIEVTIIPARIDVIGMRSESVAARPVNPSVQRTSFKS